MELIIFILVIVAGLIGVGFLVFVDTKKVQPAPKPNPKPMPEPGPVMDQTQAVIDVLRTRTEGVFLNETQLSHFLQSYGGNAYNPNNQELKELLKLIRQNFIKSEF